MASQNLSLDDFLTVAIRRKWLILSVFCVSSAIAFGVATLWPKSYRSATTILIESQKVPESYVKGVVSGTIQERLSSVRQIVLSRQLLIRVAGETGLLSGKVGDSQAADAVVTSMMKSVQIDISKEQTALKLSFSHSDPAIARDVTSKIASFIVEDNLKRREQLIEGATEFLQQELKMSKAELEIKEKAISEFKARNMGELPEQMEANLRALDRLQSERTSTSETVNALSSRLDSLDKAIREFQPGDDLATGSPLLPRGQGRVDKRLERLHELEQRLAVLSAQYKENYPDIVYLKEEIKKLRTVQGAPEEPLQDEVLPNSNSGKISGEKPRRVSDPYLNDLIKQRNEVKNDLAIQKQRLTRIAAQISEYEGRVERTPAKEQQVMMLMRDYDHLQKNYQSLFDKQLSAAISENLERHQKGEQFRVMDPAFLPIHPETPNQIAIILGGMSIGMFLGYGWAFWLEHGRGMVRTAGDAEAITGFPILATIPDFSSVCAVEEPTFLPVPTMEDSNEAQSTGVNTWLQLPRSGWRRKRQGSGIEQKREAIGDLRLELNQLAKWRPDSQVAEQYRVAATRIILASSRLKSTVVVVTSAIKGEGKSASVTNLGYVFAEDLRKKTLIVDCDFKQPSIHLYSGLSASPGLSELLSGQCDLAGSLRQAGGRGPWILTAGSKIRTEPDLAQINRLKQRIDELRNEFEYIIIDAPPILPLADMNLLSALADFIVFIVRADVTSKSALHTAVKALSVGEGGGVLLTGYSSLNQPKYLQHYYHSKQH